MFDLIRALGAAFLAAVVPGYFWARVLLASENLAERITYSVALSMALVPAVALVPASVFSFGVTPVVAFASVVLVFGSGLGAHLWLGPAKGKIAEKPAVGLPAPLKLPELALLAAALLVALVGALGFLGALPSLIISSFFTVAAGASHIVTSRMSAGREPKRGAKHRASDEEIERPLDEQPAGPTSGVFDLARKAVLPVILVCVVLRGYVGPVIHDWPFIRGVDHYSHDIMSDLMLTGGHIQPYLIYPPGFHTMTAVISRISGLEPLEIFPVLAPTFFLLPATGCYVLAKRLWGWEAGIAAAFIGGLLPGGTYYYFQDAMYPNFVTSQFLMVLTLAALAGVYVAPSWRTGLLLALLGSATAMFHQVASLYVALVLALVGVCFIPYLLLRERGRGVAMFLSYSVLGTLAVAYVWGTYDLGSVVINLLGGASGETGTAVGMVIGTQAPYPLGFLISEMVTPVVAWLGLFGGLLVVGGRWSQTEAPLSDTAANTRSKVLTRMMHLALLAWVVILFLGSRTSLSGFPQRFGRDIGIPVALLAALVFVVLLRSFLIRRRPAAFVAAAAAVLLSGTLLGLQGFSSLAVGSAPNSQLTMSPEIAAAGDWLEDHNTGGNIMVTPQENQVPSRMMLAMGDYSAMQSFVPFQITHPRDLPPSGPEPLEDVIWVINHPESAKTDRLLEKHEVRYLVLYKFMPDRLIVPYWQEFLERQDLYKREFENQHVLIVSRREAR